MTRVRGKLPLPRGTGPLLGGRPSNRSSREYRRRLGPLRIVALGRLDREHAAVYFQIIWNVVREPMRQALEKLVMEGQIEGKATFPPFAQRLIEQGERKGELKGKIEGKVEALHEALLRLLARAGLALGEGDRARIEACNDIATLDRWIENVIGAKTISDVLR